MLGRLLLVVVLGAVLLVILYAGGVSLEGLRQQIPFIESPCSPKPCAAPQGFEADVGAIQADASRVTMQVTLRNNTTRGGFEAVSYRHTSPADFRLSGSDGISRLPVFSADCPDWGEVRVERGATAGPEKLCFQSPTLGLHGAAVVWEPELGVFTHRVLINLG